MADVSGVNSDTCVQQQGQWYLCGTWPKVDGGTVPDHMDSILICGLPQIVWIPLSLIYVILDVSVRKILGFHCLIQKVSKKRSGEKFQKNSTFKSDFKTFSHPSVLWSLTSAVLNPVRARLARGLLTEHSGPSQIHSLRESCTRPRIACLTSLAGEADAQLCGNPGLDSCY